MTMQRVVRLGFLIVAAMTWIACTGISAEAGQAPNAPSIVNAKLETQTVSGSLDGTMREIAAKSSERKWVGYSVPEIAGERTICCGNYNNGSGMNCGTCNLEKEHADSGTTFSGNKTVVLEGGQTLTVLFRIEGKEVTQIRTASANCTLDVGELTFIWLNGAKAAESVALLEGYVKANNFEGRGHHDVGHGALAAIAMQADAAADRALESFVAPTQPEELRRQAAFWLGEARGKVGLSALQRMAKNDPSPDVRAHVTFALSVSREDGALDEMIRMAHEDGSAHVRGQALFWLGQKAGQKAVSTITGAIDNDPDTDVKKKAVFALSQLPKDEGVPKLIAVAQTNRNPEVRKQAMFWLGQSNDPRALQFFEQVLSK
jgi:HEAT repeats